MRTNQIDKTKALEPSRYGPLIPYGDPSWYQYMASPYYNESHARLREYCRNFVDKEIQPYIDDWDQLHKLPNSILKKLSEAGLYIYLSGTLETTKYWKGKYPADITPDIFDPFHELILYDELCRCGSGGFVWGAFCGQSIGLPPVLNFGSKEMKDRIVPDVLEGNKFISLAITEPSGGSDVANILTEARLEGDNYVVNGAKKWITAGTYADYFTTAVRTGGPGIGGISLLLIERDRKGVSTRHMKCSGVWPSGTCYVTFEDVVVPKENIIGKVNQGFKCIMNNFNHERLGIIYQANRFARVCYEDALKFANKRKTFGKKLINHDVIRDKFANMARHIEATHNWTENVTYQIKQLGHQKANLILGGPIALLKAQSTKTMEYVVREACQIFGGLSYSRGGQASKVERLNREVRAMAVPGGSEEIMLDLGMRQALKTGEKFKARF